MSDNKIIITPEVRDEMKRLSREWMFGDQRRKIEKFHTLNSKAKKGGIVFLGDSITESYPIHELIQSDVPVFNRGISGYTSKQMRENLPEMVLELRPSIVFLLIGTNDLEFDISPEQTAKNIQFISKQINDVVLNSMVYILNVYPINETFEDSIGSRTNKVIDSINSLVKSYVQDIDGIECLDLSGVLSKNGNLISDFTHD